MAQTHERADSELLAEITAGSEVAFVELYRRWRADVFRFAVAMTRSRSFADDVLQEVFLNVLENAARFDPSKGSVRAWLLGCARHVVLNRLRVERRWTGELPEHPVPGTHEEALLAEQRLVRLHAAVAELPLEYREALVLCELAELSYADAAAVLGCPIGTVRSRLHRARGLLATWLAEPRTGQGDGEPGVVAALRTGEACS